LLFLAKPIILGDYPTGGEAMHDSDDKPEKEPSELYKLYRDLDRFIQDNWVGILFIIYIIFQIWVMFQPDKVDFDAL